MNDTNSDPKRLQLIARNYSFLQGWPIACMGLLELVQGFSVMLWGLDATRVILGWLFVPNTVLLWIGLSFASSYHQQRFGTVKLSLSRWTYITLAVFFVLYIVLATLVGPHFKYFFHVPLEPRILNAGIILVLAGLLPGFPWRHYVLVGFLLMGIAFLPAVQIVSLQRFYDHGWTFIVLGIAYVLCGVIDRSILAHSLSSLRVQESHV